LGIGLNVVEKEPVELQKKKSSTLRLKNLVSRVQPDIQLQASESALAFPTLAGDDATDGLPNKPTNDVSNMLIAINANKNVQLTKVTHHNVKKCAISSKNYGLMAGYPSQ
jgi:hypothetical protein